MTHRAPSTALDAPLLPGCGKGTGRHPGRLRRVRIHGATFLALLLTTPTLAQVIPTGSPAADILLSQAITEHRVFLTCSALDPATHAQILADWQADTAAAATLLTTHNAPKDAIAAFTTAARPDTLMPTDDTPWVEVAGLCATRPDWREAYETGRIILAQALAQALE